MNQQSDIPVVCLWGKRGIVGGRAIKEIASQESGKGSKQNKNKNKTKKCHLQEKEKVKKCSVHTYTIFKPLARDHCSKLMVPLSWFPVKLLFFPR